MNVSRVSSSYAYFNTPVKTCLRNHTYFIPFREQHTNDREWGKLLKIKM